MVTKAADLLKPVSADNKRLEAVRVQLEKDIGELEAAMVREKEKWRRETEKAEKCLRFLSNEKNEHKETKERLKSEKHKALAELQKQDALTAQLEQLTVSAQLKQLWVVHADGRLMPQTFALLR